MNQCKDNKLFRQSQINFKILILAQLHFSNLFCIFALKTVHMANNSQQILPLFTRFLHEKRCTYRFRKNLYQRMLQCQTPLPPQQFPITNFIGAFQWSLTPEGHRFWEKLDNDWHSFIKKRHC